MTPLLSFRDVKRSYTKSVPVLDGVSFDIGEGEIVGLLGRNGSGKTTMVRLAIGMLFPHEGTVELFGLSPTKHPVEVKRRIGYVGETQELPGMWKAAELIALHRKLYAEWDSALERDLIARFALDTGKRIGTLSKGQAQQVALLCAVCHKPELLLLDEPAGGLDPVARREFLETTIQLLNREGTSVLFSSHHMSDVERLGGRVLLLNEGRIQVDRELDALREQVCVATLPSQLVTDHARLRALPGCTRVRQVRDVVHAVFEGEPHDVHARLVSEFGEAHAANIQCRAVPLEELFIELLGEEVLEAAA